MVATVSLHVYTSTSATTESTAQTEISFLSSDTSATTTADRTSNPVTVGSPSYEKHLRLKATSGPDNSWGAVKFWTDGTGTTNVGLRAKLAQGTGGATPGTGDTTPTTATMTGDADAYTYTTGSKGNWDTATYSTTANIVSKVALLQLQPAAAASPGNWSETLSYSYDET